MRLSIERTKTLKTLLKEYCGLDLTDEQAQEAGMAIMRFVVAKSQMQNVSTKNKESDNGQERRTRRIVPQ